MSSAAFGFRTCAWDLRRCYHTRRKVAARRGCSFSSSNSQIIAPPPLLLAKGLSNGTSDQGPSSLVGDWYLVSAGVAPPDAVMLEAHGCLHSKLPNLADKEIRPSPPCERGSHFGSRMVPQLATIQDAHFQSK
ncbi:unnamed protein product [Cuscuta europaea]|uniref:Uncharacterized protein n=1 Tax=Cuscuta europaea TaxID=41803 RepID=A0A9P0Z0H7_CUSEU|nr:unnamed protein product [Cuscuta europaea]